VWQEGCGFCVREGLVWMVLEMGARVSEPHRSVKSWAVSNEAVHTLPVLAHEFACSDLRDHETTL
jgi:hypothetical protein